MTLYLEECFTTDLNISRGSEWHRWRKKSLLKSSGICHIITGEVHQSTSHRGSLVAAGQIIDSRRQSYCPSTTSSGNLQSQQQQQRPQKHKHKSDTAPQTSVLELLRNGNIGIDSTLRTAAAVAAAVAATADVLDVDGVATTKPHHWSRSASVQTPVLSERSFVSVAEAAEDNDSVFSNDDMPECFQSDYSDNAAHLVSENWRCKKWSDVVFSSWHVFGYFGL